MKIFKMRSDYYSVQTNSHNNVSCKNSSDCGTNEECNLYDLCVCKINFEYNRFFNACMECPGLGESCSGCCAAGLSCIENECSCGTENGYFSYCHPENGVFITASQIALTAALVMGIAALIMVVYRLCTKPRYLSARHRSASQRISDFPNARNNSNFLRASLSSIQIRVLSRLRDRPPPYDSQSRRSGTTTTTTTISENVEERRRCSRDSNLPEAPPPYEGHRDVDNQYPPPYSEVILDPSGFLNPSYTDTESNDVKGKEEQQQQQPAKSH